MHLLRFFLTLSSVSDLGRALARGHIRPLTRRPRPLSQSSADRLSVLGSTAAIASPSFLRLLTKLLRPKLPLKSHSAPRPNASGFLLVSLSKTPQIDLSHNARTPA